VQDILALMRAGRWAEAELQLRRSEGPAGPVAGLLAQAVFEQGRAEEARDLCRGAMRIAKAAGDLRGLEQLRALNGRIYARLAEHTLEDSPPPELDGVDLLLHRAQQTQGPEAAALAGEALAQASTVRDRVLSRLALVRAEPERAEEHLREAHRDADEHEEPQLIAAIAKAARRAGVDFGTHRF